jgi:hypothetical protein
MARSASTKKVQNVEPAKTTSRLPRPFTPAPEQFQAYLETLSKSRVYLTHIDPHPASFKRQIFLVPVALNVSILVILAWRVYYAIPYYQTVFQQVWNNPQQPFGAGMSNATTSAMAWAAITRALMFLVDYLLLTIVAPWPMTFLVDGSDGSPVSWRAKIGFREKELVVRASRNWTAEDLLDGEKKGESSPFWQTRVLPAVAMDRIGKTGYLLMDKDWDLSFRAMVDGETALKKKDLTETDINGKLFAFYTGEWIMWDFRTTLYAKASPAPPADEEDHMTGNPEVDDGRRMILKFRAKLADMGKEDLFFRWVETIQVEASQPGGFTTERQIKAGEKVKQLFDEYGVDFEQFEKDVGIKDGRLVT